MAQRSILWLPDTCGCAVELTWDDAVPQEQRQHQYRVTQPCPIHAPLGPAAAAACAEENPRKNDALEAVRQTLGLAESDPQLTWRFDAGRRLKITLPPAQKHRANQARSAVAQAIAASRAALVDID